MLPDMIAGLSAIGIREDELAVLLHSAFDFVFLWATAARELSVVGAWSLKKLLSTHGYDPTIGVVAQVTGAVGNSLVGLLTNLPND